MDKITYEDKVAIVESSVADINKVKASDMNQIKSVVNNTVDYTINNTSSIGDLTNLETSNKTDLVSAINEINSSLDYSTNETIVGTWLGKTLYRKIYILNTVDGTNIYTVDISSLGATHSWINSAESFVETTSGEVKGFNFMEAIDNFYLRGLVTNNQKITVKVAGGQYYCGKTYICLEYTKD
jgi:hypothetical protein